MTEEAEYEVTKQFTGFQIRRYKRMLLATVRGYSDNDSFSLLFDYISGHNRSRKKIAMTAPVITAEKIPMTVPVVSGTGSFSFVMPGNYDLATIPEPLESRVLIEVIPERLVAVTRFRGRATPRQVKSRKDELMAELAKNGIEAVGETFLMRYNPPFTPGFLRRNEVGVEIRQ